MSEVLINGNILYEYKLLVIFFPETIFPPVFGRRLQAQVIKKGDRIIMEVEVTGTPEPTVTWYKDGQPVEDCLKNDYRVKTAGQSHTLIIDNGRYISKCQIVL